MDGPFLYRKQQPSSLSSSQRRYSPIKRVETSSTTAKPKVVSIPVHFVGSETVRSKSALKIQKIFRGLLVRKWVKKIECIKKEVEEIERRISDNQTAVREAKERLRINEMLMASLFKLDSVGGIDAGVRDLRKFVVKKAISLQEKLEANEEVEVETGAGELENDGHRNAIINTAIAAAVEKDDSIAQGRCTNVNINNTVEQEVEEEKAEETIVSLIQKDEDDDIFGNEEQQMAENNNNNNKCSTATTISNDGDEKMNEKMIGMMTDLIQRNEVQTRLLTSLTHRVALLEKAFLCDQLRKSYNNNNKMMKKKTNP